MTALLPDSIAGRTLIVLLVGLTLSHIGSMALLSTDHHDGTIMALDPTTGIPCESFIVPESISLSQNYPNPFNPTTVIGYRLPTKSFATLKVYDILGIDVATLVNENKEAGSYVVEWNASKFASGVYFYRLQAGNYDSVKKLILMK